ncbi:hypothetical protein [Pectobacterium brasiliense]|uniref:hypothetical protein n=1 Tax=Pectobacterium brasiliense TaxID=180957 RepID=UPI0015DF45FE|nr:hypothetical protein [Pectobacterium brasiliense]MBA0213499.1 hypothetical protein [Pectobacterium brasiliense]
MKHYFYCAEIQKDGSTIRVDGIYPDNISTINAYENLRKDPELYRAIEENRTPASDLESIRNNLLSEYPDSTVIFMVFNRV